MFVYKQKFVAALLSKRLKTSKRSSISNNCRHVYQLQIYFFRYSLFESKRVFWQFEVEGAPDSQKMLQKMLNATVDKFMENTNNIGTVVRKVINLFCFFLRGLGFLTLFLTQNPCSTAYKEPTSIFYP